MALLIASLGGKPASSCATLRGTAAPLVHTNPDATLATSPFHQTLREIRRVGSLDALGELALIALRTAADKCAVFAVKKDAYAGWMCTSQFGNRPEFSAVRIDARSPSVLSIAASGEYLGPLLKTDLHAPLVAFVKSKEPEVLAVPVRAGGKAALVFFAHELADPLAAMQVFSEVSSAATDGLEAIIRSKR